MFKRKETRNTNKNQYQLKFEITKFIIISSIIIAVLALLYSINPIENFFIKFTAVSTNFLLNLFGLNTKLSNNVISFLNGIKSSFRIISDCTNIYPFIILTGFIIAYPENIKKKFLGVILAFLLSLFVNYVRLVSVLVIAQRSITAFQYAHIYIWQTTFVAFVLFYFLWWIKWKIPAVK